MRYLAAANLSVYRRSRSLGATVPVKLTYHRPVIDVSSNCIRIIGCNRRFQLSPALDYLRCPKGAS
jgi:hypothetical protein